MTNQKVTRYRKDGILKFLYYLGILNGIKLVIERGGKLSGERKKMFIEAVDYLNRHPEAVKEPF